jgi:hypothetical protein
MDIKQADANFDWIERALETDAREHADAYVADDGFTSAVMARLPERAVLPAWRGPVLALLWLIAAAAVVVALPDLFYDVFRGLVAIVVAQPLTWSRVAAAVLVLGALTWSTIVYAMRAE